MPAPPFNDAFTDANGTPLLVHNASFSLNAGNFGVQTNALAANGASSTTECAAGWSADALADDQYVQATLAGTSGGVVNARIGVGVRLAIDGSANYYGLYYDDDAGETYLFKSVSGVITQLGASFNGVRSVSEIFRLEVVSGILEYFLNSISQGTRSDSSFASGSAGVVGKGLNTGHRIDDWEGGNIGAVPDVAPIRSRKLATQQRMVA